MEAIDLGCAMTRAWWPQVMLAWLAVFLPITLCAAILFHGMPTVAFLVMWLFKPLYDRAVLEVLGRAVFGEHPQVRDVLRAALRSPGLLASLTVLRFDPARAFKLPVAVLERLRGREASQRIRVLRGRSSGAVSS